MRVRRSRRPAFAFLLDVSADLADCTAGPPAIGCGPERDPGPRRPTAKERDALPVRVPHDAGRRSLNVASSFSRIRCGGRVQSDPADTGAARPATRSGAAGRRTTRTFDPSGRPFAASSPSTPACARRRRARARRRCRRRRVRIETPSVLPSGDHVGCQSFAASVVTWTARPPPMRLDPDVEVARLGSSCRR